MMLKISTSNDKNKKINNSGTNNSSSNKLLSWWQKKKLFSFQHKNKNKTRSIMTTQNWRNLSPDEPPLPFLVNKTIPSIKFSEVDNFGSELAPTLKDVEYIPSTSLYISQRPSSSRELYTIPELSEMNTTVTTNNSSTISSSVTPPITNTNIPNNMSSEAIDSSSFIHHHTNTSLHTLVTTREQQRDDGDQQDVLCIVPPLPPQPSSSSSVQQHYNSNDDATSFTTTLHTTYNNNSEKLPPMILISDSDDDEEDNNKNINDQYVPISDWPSLLGSCEPQFKSSLLGNESECKLLFSHLLESAYKYHNEKKRNEPKEMRLVFNEEGNIRGVSIILQDGKREDYLEFGGSTQYIPPELSANATYNDELADIWSLGISLYRMLIGRYPFTHMNNSESDLKLFKRMLNSDFNVPARLSDDVEDLLFKMLAPENSRATFDIVLFHPWIKSHIHPDHLTREETTKEKKKKKSVGKVLAKVLKKAIRLVFLGPYPPPKKHHYYYTSTRS